ncbi:glutamate receptor 3.4 isoform X2 [Cryptomeria japonica]|uniref:glutamate receptor 3.4 isoform X2 n=1 Tax=Cryptomeria japonica TaxID=3369 RepID=UPI0027DA2959|nr:glutamate receptor 3.4 isoform X2 [Cryptomeria japonica]
MHLMVGLFLVMILCLLFPQDVKPEIINIGALLAYNTTIGDVARRAIELAVEDVNKNSSVLNGNRLVLSMVDSNCSAWIGTAAALELLQKDVVAIVGPQSSPLAHIVSQLASELQVPLLSFAATDPTLSSYQYPYFLRITHSDSSQMEAIADVIGYYGWRKVVVVYIDDDYGRNGILVLGDALRKVRAKIVYKAALPPDASRSGIGSVLMQLALMESRVLVVHTNPNMGLNIFAEASLQGMLNSGYVWMATDWLSSTLDSRILDSDTMNSLQGVIGLRKHTPISEDQRSFTARWNNLLKSRNVDTHLNIFGLHAYDTVWVIARAISTFLSEGGNTSFVSHPELSTVNGKKSELAQLKIFQGGLQLLKILRKTKLTGLAGPIQLDKHGDLLGPTFEIINIAGTDFRTVGYWSSQFGLYVNPLESNRSRSKQQLYDIIWPGGRKVVPCGWLIPNNEKKFLIGVPKKAGFEEFVTTVEGNNTMKGFCIEVFVAAVNLLPYAFPYTFVSFIQNNSTPSYNDLVEQVVLKKLDAVVGDISILKNRSEIVEFTLPYIDSGLVVVTPVRDIHSNNPWAFLKPFTPGMWCAIGGSFFMIGAVVWFLEHKANPDFRGQPKKQFATIFWFSFSTLFFSHRENILTALGRAVLIIWLFVVLIITSSYTANLSSIFTARQLSSTIDGIDSLKKSGSPVGYQTGSFARNYLIHELGIDPSRLIPLDSPEKYAKALSDGPKRGGVAAIVDELPYAQVFLSIRCGYTLVGQQISRNGWGFAFQKDSELAIDISTAILTLSENGELQRIHDKWLSQTSCNSRKNQVESDQLSLKSFWGLFLIIGLACFVSLFVFFYRMILQYIRHSRNLDNQDGSASHSGSLTYRSAKIIRSFASFVDEKKTESSKRKRSDQQGSGSNPSHDSSHLNSNNQAFTSDPQTAPAQTAE